MKRFFSLKKVNFRQQKTVSKKKKNERGKNTGKFDIIQNSSHKRHESSQAKILEEITAAIAAFVRYENRNNNVTDGFFDTLGEISESVQKDFDKLVGISNDKKTFVRAPAKIFTLRYLR